MISRREMFGSLAGLCCIPLLKVLGITEDKPKWNADPVNLRWDDKQKRWVEPRRLSCGEITSFKMFTEHEIWRSGWPSVTKIIIGSKDEKFTYEFAYETFDFHPVNQIKLMRDQTLFTNLIPHQVISEEPIRCLGNDFKLSYMSIL